MLSGTDEVLCRCLDRATTRSRTFPGHSDQVGAARQFVREVLGGRPCTDNAVLLASESAVERFGLTPVARVVSSAAVGVDPSYMGIGPVGATHTALRRAGWELEDLETVELNEAFAAQILANERALRVEPRPRQRLRRRDRASVLAVADPRAEPLPLRRHPAGDADRRHRAADHHLGQQCLHVAGGVRLDPRVLPDPRQPPHQRNH